MSLADELKNYIEANGFVSISDLNEYTISLKHKNPDGVLVSYKISNGERRLRQLEEAGKIERVPIDRTKPVRGYKSINSKGECGGIVQEKAPVKKIYSIEDYLKAKMTLKVCDQSINIDKKIKELNKLIPESDLYIISRRNIEYMINDYFQNI